MASFTAPSSVTAGDAAAFDATASSDPDGDALTFNWVFGDGSRGGTSQIAHLFAASGSFNVALTVTDSRGATATAQRTVTVQAGASAGAPVGTVAVVRDTAGNALSGVTVTVAGSSTAANTAADGRATVQTAVGVPVTLLFQKAGYADQSKTIALPVGAEAGYVEATLLAREAALTLANAAAGGTLNGKDGAKVTLPANALITAGGATVTGAVQVNVTPVDVGANVQAFPGKFAGVRENGEQGIILSYGTVEYALSQNGAPLNLAPGKMAQIEIPVYTTLNRDGSEVKVGDAYPLWSLDEKTGIWIQEGTGIVVASTSSPSGLALRGEVSHFSWWNHDIFDIPPYKPKPECLVDTDHDGILEDLTDTGFCWHYGTGPDQPDLGTGNLLAEQKLSPAAMRALEKAATTRRLPAVAAYDTTPAGGGKVLPIPANMNITFVSTAKNGTLRGTRVLRGASNVEEDVTIVLYPVGAAGQNEAMTLPFDQSYAMNAIAELDGFNFSVAAGEEVEVTITRLQGSTLTGTYAVKGPNDAVLGTGSLDATGAPIVVTTTQAGQHRIELTSASGVPGGYRIQVRVLGCDTTVNVTLPVDQQFNINGNALACFNVTLPANTALAFEVPFFSGGLTGTMAVLNSAGAELGRDDFGGTFNAALVYLGVRQAGAYRIRVANAQPGPGNFTLRANTLTAEALAVPATGTWTDITTSSSKRVLITPPTDGLHGLVLTTTRPSFLMQIDPQEAVVSGSSAIAVRMHPDVLPVVHLARTSGFDAASVTLQTVVPQPLTLNTELSGTVADQPLLYWFDGMAGEQLSAALATPTAQSDIVIMQLRSPAGALLGAAPFQATSPTMTSGVYSAVVERIFGTSTASFTLRANTVAPPEALTLTSPSTERTVTLALGETKRFTVELAQADVVGLGLATSGPMLATAIMNGVNDLFVSTPGGAGPQAAWRPGHFVTTTGSYVLQLSSQSQSIETASGTVTVRVHRPMSTPLALNMIGNVSVAAQSFEALSLPVSAGRYLARMTRSGTECCSYARLWAPSTQFTAGYMGELTLTGGSDQTALLGAGTHTFTIERSAGSATSENFTVALIDLETPTVLAQGTPNSGTIDVAGERDYHRLTGVGGQNYTLNVSAGFNGTVYVYKLAGNGDFTSRFLAVPGLPVTVTSGVPASIPFTIPTGDGLGNGDYIIEVTAEAIGNYSVGVTSP